VSQPTYPTGDNKKSSNQAGLFIVEFFLQRSNGMKKNSEKDLQVRRRSIGKPLATLAAILAVIQACLTIEGRGIEGFILWVLILFVGYWLFFMFLRWLWVRFRGPH
jgi:hypothetical protein